MLFNGDGLETPAAVTTVMSDDVTVSPTRPCPGRVETVPAVAHVQARLRSDRVDGVVRGTTEFVLARNVLLPYEYTVVSFPDGRVAKRVARRA